MKTNYETIRGPAGVRGIPIGVSPAGVTWVRWLKAGELSTARKVRKDVDAMRARLVALWAGRAQA